MKTKLNIIWSFLKITFSGAIIFGIAFAFGVFDKDIQVAESKADLIDYFGNQSNTKRFVNSLERLGHDKPRVFDLNGNVVYFSQKKHRDAPLLVFDQYQEEFFQEGINSKRWKKVNNSGDDEFTKASISGEIVPLSLRDEYVAMGGMLSRGETGEKNKMMKLVEKAESPASLFRGHRFIEIVKDKKGFGSEAIAMFSGEEFDYNKMKPGYSGPGANPDPLFPSCPGCTRLTRFSELQAKVPFTINSFETPKSLDGTQKFYVDSMRRRGWEMTESSYMFQRLKKHVGFEGDDAHQLQFSKGGEFMTILLYPNKTGGVDVHGTLTY